MSDIIVKAPLRGGDTRSLALATNRLLRRAAQDALVALNKSDVTDSTGGGGAVTKSLVVPAKYVAGTAAAKGVDLEDQLNQVNAACGAVLDSANDVRAALGLSLLGLGDSPAGKKFDFEDADVDTGAETFTQVGHGFVTGEGPIRVTNVGGAVPVCVPTLGGTDFWIIRVDADTIKLATSLANARAGTAITVTTAAGGGTHTLAPLADDVEAITASVTSVNDGTAATYASAAVKMAKVANQVATVVRAINRLAVAVGVATLADNTGASANVATEALATGVVTPSVAVGVATSSIAKADADTWLDNARDSLTACITKLNAILNVTAGAVGAIAG